MSRRAAPLRPLLAVGILGFVVGSLVAPRSWSLHAFLDRPQRAEPRSVTDRSLPLTPDERIAVDLFDRTAASVVFIATGTRPGSSDPRLAIAPDGRPGAPPTPAPVPPAPPDAADDELEWDSGSGFVWDQRGHVVTNFHVVESAERLVVRLPDLSDWTATLVGHDEDKDLAVLHIEAPPERLVPISLGRSAELCVGQRAYSLGNPFGLSSTLTEGIISATGRTIRSGTGAGRIIQDVIQTDAAINPGNSGGPLLDSAGRLVGVTTAMVSDSGNSAGIGFAIPVDTVNRIVPDLINWGGPARAGLGVRVQMEIDRKIDGVMIAYVLPGSAAEHAGLRGTMNPETLKLGLGDVIVAVDGIAVRSFDDLYTALDTHVPGDVVEVTYRRKGALTTTPIELQLLTPALQDADPSPED